jgi:transposase
MLTRWIASHESSTTGGSVLRTTRRNEPFADLRLEESYGCSPASSPGAGRAAVMTTLIATAKLNGIDSLAWLADALARIAEISQARLPELPPWICKLARLPAAA